MKKIIGLFILFVAAVYLSSSFSPKQDSEPVVEASSSPAPIEVSQDAFSLAEIEGDEPEQVAEEFIDPPSGFAATSFPVANFQAYTSPFGYRTHPVTGQQGKFHFGLDVAGPHGSPLLAWASGTVVRAVHVDKEACGLYVDVKSGPWNSIYCHASKVMVNVGDQVEAGQPIALLGTTGSSTGPHLHWGLKYEGLWVDPNLVLLAMKNQ